MAENGELDATLKSFLFAVAYRIADITFYIDISLEESIKHNGVDGLISGKFCYTKEIEGKSKKH